MVRRTRLLALATLAIINVITLVGGIAVALMLPARLAALRIPSVAAGRVAVAGPVLTAGSSGPLPTASGLDATLSGPLSAASLGPHVLASVIDPLTGQVLFSRGATQLATPASTAKLATATAALSVLGPGARFSTRVVATRPGDIILVGGGDPVLAVNAYPAGDYPQPATLASLAGLTARALKAAGRTSVQVGFDTSLYTGPEFAPGWPASYVSTGNVTQIVPLEVDQGRLNAAGNPEDSDDPGNFQPRAVHPSQMAANAFAALLSADGIKVTGPPSAQTAPSGAQELASVNSPPLSAMIEQMLAESNNVIAENLARHVALATGYPATFAGGAAAVTATLRRLGVMTGFTMVDGSGLSPDDAVAPATLTSLLRVVVAQPRLRDLLAGLPVAGFSGTLASGESAFGVIDGAALGMVRAKTGNLSSVTTLAGLAYDKDGTLLAFAFMADQVASLDGAAAAIDQAAAQLAGCGCRLAYGWSCEHSADDRLGIRGKDRRPLGAAGAASQPRRGPSNGRRAPRARPDRR
jgi:D-alanyl-D-alanine carboxypeptidase/D-alanyl-D-alanine-endopeptidase (penicillin-binding protein 4)